MPTARRTVEALAAEARPEPEVALELITPEIARRWLAANYGNRELTPSHAEVLVRAMKRGEWGLGWDGIAFDVDGRLLNGQHRLAAVALSGVAQRFVIARGWPKNSAEYNDHGKKRTLSEILQMRGVPDYRNLAGAIKFTWYYMRHETFQPPKVGPTVSEQLALWDRHSGEDGDGGLLDALRRARLLSDKGKRSPMPITPGAALLYLFSHIEPTDADTFFVKLADGTELAEGDPILVLRNQLMRSRLKGNKVSQHVKAAWTILAWNAWQDGVQVERLRWTAQRPYPKIANLVVAAEVDPELAAQTEPPRPPKIDLDALIVPPDDA
jgi:hypothetical protein